MHDMGCVCIFTPSYLMDAVALLGIIYAARRAIITVESKILSGEAGPLSRVTFGEQKIKGKQTIERKNTYIR